MAPYTVQQHDSFVSASYRRKHLNALILDLSREYEKTQNHLCSSSPYGNTHLGASASAAQLSASLMASMSAMELQQQQQQQREQQQIKGMSCNYSSSSCSTTSQQEFTQEPSWLLPWQTGNRRTGRQFAVAIKSKRTPNGGFANHDLPVAPK